MLVPAYMAACLQFGWREQQWETMSCGIALQAGTACCRTIVSVALYMALPKRRQNTRRCGYHKAVRLSQEIAIHTEVDETRTTEKSRQLTLKVKARAHDAKVSTPIYEHTGRKKESQQGGVSTRTDASKTGSGKAKHKDALGLRSF